MYLIKISRIFPVCVISKNQLIRKPIFSKFQRSFRFMESFPNY